MIVCWTTLNILEQYLVNINMNMSTFVPIWKLVPLSLSPVGHWDFWVSGVWNVKKSCIRLPGQTIFHIYECKNVTSSPLHTLFRWMCVLTLLQILMSVLILHCISRWWIEKSSSVWLYGNVRRSKTDCNGQNSKFHGR